MLVAHKIALDDDDGWVELEVAGGSFRLDLYKCNNTYAALCDKYDPESAADAEKLCGEWAEWLTAQGVPRVSHATAFALADAVVARVASLKKTPAPTSPSADSPAPTE